ncbi:General stress protein A [Rubripirellula lacrimiformis]|uniref:General stress protein A n=1 Tax=Rubripirellula lacrimiformis TaxID=1930273 RepID=A0A517NEZ1_9BACT|nr:glycosyltransferase family 8 protein [Rubripirellula lacrimiformis]QDT05701.1 General stress protein A [Rubripirellula lacrimiformis]
MMTDSNKSSPMVVVTGADENYSIGLVVTIQSMLMHLGPGRRVVLHVFDGGISPESKKRILDSWTDQRLTTHWHQVDMKDFAHLTTAGHLNHTTYLRLLIPDLLGSEVGKVIYLDSDLLIRRDLGLLWDEDVEPYSVLAGQEVSSPYVDSEIVFAESPEKYSKLGTTAPIANYREIGISPDAKVFNAGVLLINVARWRSERVPEQAYECLQRYREHVLFCDQYALNVVLRDSWKEIDSRWNQNSHFYAYTDCHDSPLDEVTFRDLTDDPWICHFTWIYKPWYSDCVHPHKDEYVACLRTTQWHRHRLQRNPALKRDRRTFRQWVARRKGSIERRLTRLGIIKANEDSIRRAA